MFTFIKIIFADSRVAGHVITNLVMFNTIGDVRDFATGIHDFKSAFRHQK